MQFKHKRKGRKLFTSRDRNHRIFHRYHPMRSALGVVITLVMIGFLGVVGYNVIGPLVTRLHAEAESPTKTDDPFFEQATEPVITTGTVLSSTSASSAITTQTTAVSSVQETTVHTARYGADTTLAYEVTPEIVSDLQLLETAAERYSASGCSALILPLKVSGGQLLYASAVKDAVTCGASAESPTLEEITAILSAHGMKGIAQIDLLGDNVFPAAFTDGGFQILENKKRWLDRAEADGGKPWISPYSDYARSYLASITKELTDAGFGSVICQGISFPKFFNSDEKLLGKQITDEKRRKEGLIGVINAIAEKEPTASFSFSLYDIVYKKAEAFDAEKMKAGSVCMIIDPAKFKSAFFYDEKRYSVAQLSDSDKVTELLGLSKQILGDIKLIPCFVRGSMTDEQMNAVLDTAHSVGYSEIYITD